MMTFHAVYGEDLKSEKVQLMAQQQNKRPKQQKATPLLE